MHHAGPNGMVREKNPSLTRGCCLPYQSLRQKILDDLIHEPHFDDGRIQPASFEPIIGNECYILDASVRGLFRPTRGKQVYRSLLEMPRSLRPCVDITNGYEVRPDFTYLFPLEERITLLPKEFVKCSPKSTSGRMFNKVKTFADLNATFDQMNAQCAANVPLQLWLRLQPSIAQIVYPGMSFSQLRFFTGLDAVLSASEVAEVYEQTPLFWQRADDGTLQQLAEQPLITEGLLCHLDLTGKHTHGIGALKLRKNPHPIDLRKSESYKPEEYFEPLKGTRIKWNHGDKGLFCTKEVLRIPPHVSAELRSFDDVGLRGTVDDAGFIDNGFTGDLVFEIQSDEDDAIELEDGMPISTIDIYRTLEIPQKLYGKKTKEGKGNNYQGQIGPKAAKYFIPFDYADAARNYKKLDRDVLVQDARVLHQHRTADPGFQILPTSAKEQLVKDITDGFFHNRYECETDTKVLQVIPYLIAFRRGDDGTKQVFSYVRSENIEDYGDKRLFGKHSIGLGGHTIREDAPHYLQQCLEREVFREEVAIVGAHTPPKLVGTLFATDKPVDRVHFGLIYVTRLEGSIAPKELSIKSGRLLSIDEIIADTDYPKRYETWSAQLIKHLPALYHLTED